MSRGVPDVLGMLLSRAETLLAEANIRYTVSLTVPPRGEPPAGPMRVVRVTPGDSSLDLLASPTVPEPRF